MAKKASPQVLGPLAITQSKRLPADLAVPPSSRRQSRRVSDDFVNINFKVSRELSKRFRQFALDREMKLNELFRASFEVYEKQPRGTAVRS